MRSEHIIPALLITLDIGCAIVYGVKGEPWRALYWIAAGLISFASVKM